MSNHLAIATVSAAVGQLVQDALDTDVPGATISHERPGGPNDSTRSGTNIFLYQVQPATHFRNIDLPTRGPAGGIVTQPTVALDLNYLFTFFGDVTLFEPERMAASLARLLHQRPVLNRDLLKATIDANPASLGGSDLADAPELVKFTPTPINLEELSKLWSILFQTSYRLSVVYSASVVQIDSRSRSQPALPVQTSRVFTAPQELLEIRAIERSDRPGGAITWGSDIRLLGRGFDRLDVRLRVGDADIPLNPAQSTTTETVLTLDAATLGTTLETGMQSVRLVRPFTPDAPAHIVQSSSPNAFLLQPTLTIGAVIADPINAGSHDGTIDVTADPPISETQEVVLQLNRIGDGGSAALSPTIPGGAVFPLAALSFQFTDLLPSIYIARIRVDGAESPLLADENPISPTFGEIVGPEVMVP